MFAFNFISFPQPAKEEEMAYKLHYSSGRIDKPPFVSTIFTKGNNFVDFLFTSLDFLFASQDNIDFHNGFHAQRKEFAPIGANSFL